MTNGGRSFEDDVRRVARLLWSEDAFSGAALVDGRERDGIFETRDTVNIVECTISRNRDKAVEDAKKTAETVQKFRKDRPKHINGWLITLHEPTADQRTATQRFSHSVRLLSFDQFRSLLFNGRQYLRCRADYRFGSVADPITKAAIIDIKNYIPVDLFESGSQTNVNIETTIVSLQANELNRFVLLGEYGSGKSVTLRNIFFRIKDSYQQNSAASVPIYLNLRDHTGQKNPVEALERHARNIGYPGNSGDLVRAWRAGFTTLLLDGFDEMATAGWGGSLQKVRTHRYSGMTLVRKFIEESPKETSVILAGRHNFFDNPKEMAHSLGVEKGFSILNTSDFTEEQAKSFLKSLGISANLPGWMPRRPLLLAYLAARGFLTPSITAESSKLSPAAGWDNLLTMICEREAQQDDRLDPTTVRTLLERLSTLARATEDGRGRIDILTIQNTFRDIAGFPPDEAAQQFILRLPALGPTSLEDSSREFVDGQIADAARAGDVLRFIDHPHNNGYLFEGAVCPLGEISTNLISERISDGHLKPAVFVNAIKIAAQNDENEQLAMDLAVVLTRSPEISFKDKIVIQGAVCDHLLLDDATRQLSNLIFDDCLFHMCEISKDVPPTNIPQFNNCLFGVLDGYFGKDDLPKNFVNPDISEFALAAETSAQILHADIPEGLKILLVVLRKLYLQSGAARQESAFYRGAIDSRSAHLVPEVLKLLAKQGLAEEVRHRGKDLWLPNRKESARVRKILSSPMTSSDDLVSEAKSL